MQITSQNYMLNGISYVLTHKKIKNINVRIRADGSVAVSAPMRCPHTRIDAFLQEKAAWITAARARVLSAPPLDAAPCTVSPEAALALFAQVSAEIFPLFAAAPLLAGTPPTLKVRAMKTRWGVCHITKRQITLNLRLAQYPRAAVEYVILHEYAHFLQGNHSPAFWATVGRFMPDYKARKALLKQPQ